MANGESTPTEAAPEPSETEEDLVQEREDPEAYEDEVPEGGEPVGEADENPEDVEGEYVEDDEYLDEDEHYEEEEYVDDEYVDEEEYYEEDEYVDDEEYYEEDEHLDEDEYYEEDEHVDEEEEAYGEEPVDEDETVVTVDESLAGDEQAGPRPEELEASLNDLAATLTSLSQNIQEIKEFRDEMEGRLSEVEERMVRLGSLAEAVSMQYNPFLGDEAPGGETGATGPSRFPDVPDGEASPDRSDEPADPPERSRDPPSEPADADAEGPAAKRAPSTSIATSSSPSGGDDERLEKRMLLMEWVKFMLERVGRVGLLDLLEYYEELGWLDEADKDQVMQVAVGVDGPDRVEDADWKGDRELHERSLIALERLRGNEVTGQTLDSIHLDLDRLFGG